MAKSLIAGRDYHPRGRNAHRPMWDILSISCSTVVEFRPDTLIATADSPNSARERLTLTALSQALGIPIDLRCSNKDLAALVHELTSEAHGKSVLIAWHHGTLPQIIEALGGDPHTLLPDGYWPDNVFDTVVVLRYDHDGEFIAGSEQIIHEDFANPPGQIRGANSQ